VRVLYASHTALVSGAERSLLELLGALPTAVEPIVASPEGPLADRVRALGIPHVVVRGSTATLKLHPVRTPQALGGMALAAGDLRRAARSADLVHANSARAGLVASATGRPVVVHLRDTVPPGPLGRVVRAVVERQAQVVAISRHVAAAFPPGAPVTVVHNPVDLARFTPTIARAEARRALGIPDGAPALGVVAQITPWKGQDVAIEVLRLLRDRHPDAVLLLAGEAKFVARETTFDNQAYQALLHERAGALGPAVRFLGEIEDVPQLLAALDLLLVPSWSEPFGRSIIEAMAMATPVLATDQGGPPEILEDGVTGRLLAPRDARAWAEAASALLGDEGARDAMGEAARQEAQRFDRDAYARRIAELYAAIIGA
jgi:glycosyltransferase involved in cell wall biosynthesis